MSEFLSTLGISSPHHVLGSFLLGMASMLTLALGRKALAWAFTPAPIVPEPPLSDNVRALIEKMQQSSLVYKSWVEDGCTRGAFDFKTFNLLNTGDIRVGTQPSGNLDLLPHERLRLLRLYAAFKEIHDRKEQERLLNVALGK